MVQIHSLFKNKHVKILSSFFAIALILFTSFSNLIIPVFAANVPSDGNIDITGVWILNKSLTFPDSTIRIENVDGYFYTKQSQNGNIVQVPISYINITNSTFKQFTLNYSPTASYYPYYQTINHSGGGETWKFTFCSNSANCYSLDASDVLARTLVFNSNVDNQVFSTWLQSNAVKQYIGPDYGNLVLGQTRVFKQNPAPVSNILVSDEFSFTDANGNTYSEFIAANMLTDGNPLLYIRYGETYAYGSLNQSTVILRTWNQPYYRQITFNELPDDQFTIDYILANSDPVAEPDVPLDPDDPYNAGYNVGYGVGYGSGYDAGYDVGYDEGFAAGDYQNGYQAGYEKGVSNTFVKSLFFNFFGGIVEAIDSITLYEEGDFCFSLWDVFISMIVISIIITILVVYRGG